MKTQLSDSYPCDRNERPEREIDQRPRPRRPLRLRRLPATRNLKVESARFGCLFADSAILVHFRLEMAKIDLFFMSLYLLQVLHVFWTIFFIKEAKSPLKYVVPLPKKYLLFQQKNVRMFFPIQLIVL